MSYVSYTAPLFICVVVFSITNKQIQEFVHKMIESCSEEISVVLGSCTGMVTSDTDNHDDDDDNTNNNGMLITGVRYHPRNDNDDTDAEEQILQADAVVVSAGPWSCQSEDWFEHSNIVLPMEGVKSTSIVWKKPDGDNDVVDPTALFCGEDDRFQTHRMYTYIHIYIYIYYPFSRYLRPCLSLFNLIRFFSFHYFSYLFHVFIPLFPR